MHFDINNLLEVLPIMGKGMLGIFIVSAVIVVTVLLLNRLTGNRG